MSRNTSFLFILVLLTIIPSGISNVNSQEAPHIDGEKIVTPQRVLEGQTMTVTIRLTGSGDLILTPVDIVLILDRSGSMRGDKIVDAKEAAKSFLEFTEDIDKVSLVTFSNEANIDFELQFMDQTNKDSLSDKIDTYRAGGSTNIFDAIVTANDILTDSPRVNAPLVEVLLTDGQHNHPTFLSDSDFESLANQAKDKGIIIFTIGLGSDVNSERLEIIANVTGGKYFFAPTSGELENIFEGIASYLNFAGTNIEVTETIPSYLTYKGDASKTPDDITGNEETTLKWNVGTIWVGEEWEVTYTAQAKEAVESSDLISQTRIEYIKTDASEATIDLTPGLIFNDISISNLHSEYERVTQGDINDITLTVESKGSIQRTFDLEIKYNNKLLNKQSITLNPGQTENIIYSWNTSNAEKGKFVITATLDPDQKIWEQDRTDNQETTEIEISAVGEYPFILLFIAFLLILIVPIIAATMYSKPRGGPPTCEECGDFLFYDKRYRRWYCRRCRRYVS